MRFDGWEFPEACVKCKSYSNGTKKEPIQYLDVKTRLCEHCFSDLYDDENSECEKT